MSEDGLNGRVEAREAGALPERTLEGPGSDARAERLRARFRASRLKSEARGGGLPTSQLVLLGVVVFLLVVMFGAGRYIIAAVAPKPPPSVNLPR